MISLPSDVLTIIWLMVATYAVKILDGLDGLVTGLTIIGSSIVAALSLSLTYFQPPVALLAGLIGGSYLGFLPRNFNPAKQFLGESGSTIAGFSLGFLAILSSAKVAIALSVLAIPITDVVIVIFGRIHRGQPWFRGDDTHLHFRLIKAGLSNRAAVLLYWGVSLIAGIFVLSLQTQGKIFIIFLLCLATALASYIAGLRSRRAREQV
jgi:UDP-GlcNAc:undecaprenyl-phosphate GlcNAc-1-phosphate transferase